MGQCMSCIIWLIADCDVAEAITLCSAFYERLKEVRDYHRRYPYLEVIEVREKGNLDVSQVSVA